MLIKKEESKSWPSIFFFIKWHHAVGLGNCFFVFFIFSAISCRTRHFCERVRVLDTYRYLQQFFSYNMSTWIFCVRIRIRIRIRILGTKCIYRHSKQFFSNNLTTRINREEKLWIHVTNWYVNPKPHLPTALGRFLETLTFALGISILEKYHLWHTV